MPIRPRRPVAGQPVLPVPDRFDHIRVRNRTRIAPPAPVHTPPDQTQPAAPKRAHHIVDKTGENWDEEGNYLVGKYRPPKASQWKKGQSGNPKGPKPKEKLSPEDAFDRELLTPFVTRINGEEETLNLGSLILRLMKSGAAKGQLRAQQQLLTLYLDAMRRQAAQESDPGLHDDEIAALTRALDMLDLPEQPVRREIDRSIHDTGDAE